MYISTEMSSFYRLGSLEKVLDLLKESGFTAFDFSMFGGLSHELLLADDYKEKARALRNYADGLGWPCNQAHAPFPTVRKGDEEFNEKMFPKVCRAIEVAGILGAKVCVVHPCNDYTAEENAELYKKFEPVARKAGVKIGVEYMFNGIDPQTNFQTPAACSHHDDFRRHLELLPRDVFVACLDIGHAELCGLNTSAVQMIETLGDRLEAIHLHDNDKLRDRHQVPFSHGIDFGVVIAALKKVGYKGDITMESDRFAANAPVELIPAAGKYLACVAEYFRSKVCAE